MEISGFYYKKVRIELGDDKKSILRSLKESGSCTSKRAGTADVVEVDEVLNLLFIDDKLVGFSDENQIASNLGVLNQKLIVDGEKRKLYFKDAMIHLHMDKFDCSKDGQVLAFLDEIIYYKVVTCNGEEYLMQLTDIYGYTEVLSIIRMDIAEQFGIIEFDFIVGRNVNFTKKILEKIRKNS